ncbi:Fe-S-containing hydro-lyase [Texcoconibacillus texcoconensis]|uniref:Fumarate hydratase subunit beta n=1 Tax=Texcoconibacillus texcoconensis TaxID=1095777 RepID=A0A840QM07_9BACI|nr:Fe-S-containing hydro-lyase [Texcoconibacillus texcoconensis]MBB5172412.1 fumarate hydratase subunit beta [Texcoconibacillus texcoconensis]
MSNVKSITLPLTKEKLKDLKCGDRVSLSGVIYTARDAAHKNIVTDLVEGNEPPISLENQIVYYAGPTPPKPGKVIGSCGPTTSSRMDSYSPRLIEKGLTGMIGKGPRSKEVIDAMVEHSAVYFAAIGGAAALIADSVKSAEVVAYDDLGPEAIRKLEVEDYPCIVAIDSEGNNLYELGVEQYKVVD